MKVSGHFISLRSIGTLLKVHIHMLYLEKRDVFAVLHCKCMSLRVRSTYVVGNTKLQSSVDTGLVLESLCKCCPVYKYCCDKK